MATRKPTTRKSTSAPKAKSKQEPKQARQVGASTEDRQPDLPKEPNPAQVLGAQATTDAPEEAPEAHVAAPDASEHGTGKDEAVSDDTGDDKPATATDESTVIRRVFKGATYELVPQADGTFKLGDETFKSLTAAAKRILGVTGGVSGPRWWLGSSVSGRSRLTREQRAAREAQKAADKARKAEEKAAALRAAEVTALDEVIGMLREAITDGRLTDEQRAKLKEMAG